MCGLVKDWHQYGDEGIEFIRISADGSQESESAHWYDTSKNGKMDGEDCFRVHGDSVNMEQYFQYKQEHVPDPESDKIEWTGKRLKHFETWKEAIGAVHGR